MVSIDLRSYAVLALCFALSSTLDLSFAFKRRRVCFQAAAPSVAAQNLDPSTLSYSLQRLSWQPIWPSSPPQVGHGVPVRDSVFSSLSCQRLVSWLRLFA